MTDPRRLRRLTNKKIHQIAEDEIPIALERLIGGDHDARATSLWEVRHRLQVGDEVQDPSLHGRRPETAEARQGRGRTVAVASPRSREAVRWIIFTDGFCR